MKIIIDENEKIINDGKVMMENQINSDFFEKVVEEGLNNNLSIEINSEKSSPLAKLFIDIQDMVKENSEFRKKLNEIEEEEKQLKEDVQKNDK